MSCPGPTFPKGVVLAPHPPSEGWSEARLFWLPDPAENLFNQEQCELAALLRRRVRVRYRHAWMPWADVLAALSSLPQADLDLAKLHRRMGRYGDLGTEPRYTLHLRQVQVFARCEVVAAVVAAAVLTRRPMLALSALSTRYLMEGRAVVVRK